MSEWSIVQLGNVVDLLTGFPFSSASYSDAPSAIRLLRGDNIAPGAIRWHGAKRWPSENVDGAQKFLLTEGDVVLAMDRPWIEAGLKYASVRKDDCPALLVQRVARLRGGSRLCTRFLRYVIGSQAFTNHVLAVQTGTAVPHISSAQIKTFQFSLPPLHHQHSIVAILGALDDKIDLNRRMNETLEAMARAIFKDWFIDFGPTQAKLESRARYLAQDVWDLFPDRLNRDGKPEGWSTRPLLDYARIISGGTPRTDEGAYWGGPIAWASAKDVSQCREAFLVESERTITDRGLRESATRMVPRWSTVVVARGATTGRSCMLGRDMAMNQTCYALASKYGHDSWLNCAFRESVGSLLHAAHGSVFDTITTRTMESARVNVPSGGLIGCFEAIARPLFSRVLVNVDEAKTLAGMRDLLLPKLLSGEIRVGEAERAVEAVA